MIYLNRNVTGDHAAQAVIEYLPTAHYRADELQAGDLVWTQPNGAALVGSVRRLENGTYEVLDVRGNGSYGHAASSIFTAVPRHLLAGTPEQRLAHARGDLWLPTLLLLT